MSEGGVITMPIVTVQMLEGRTDEQKRALVEKVTEAVAETTNVPKDRVSVIIQEMAPNHFARGGVRVSDQES